MDLDGIEIPEDLDWTDEWSWTPYAQSAGYALDGTLIVERSEPAAAGRPVTLQGDTDLAWLQRDTLEALRAKLGDTDMTLTLWDGRQLQVGWRHEDGPIEATEYIGTGWFHSIVLRLREV